ncbi:MAG: thiamine pyrophosphate-dependent enzyme [Hyphomicrobium sp.]|jgi:pyruvate dehydrogenase E1 component alpha subunit
MADDITFSAEEELAAYRAMLLIRRFEEKAGQLYALGAIKGLCPLSIGQEASIVGLIMAARPDDPVITAYRSHGHMLARGISPEAMLAELLGRASGLSRGKGGSVNMMAKDKAFFGGFRTPGLPAPLGTGLAFASRYRQTSNVTLCFFGDGAASTGRVFESLKIAGDWRLPIVFVIDNNGADSAAHIGSASALSEAGEPFGIPGEQVDGIDVRRARAAGRRAIDRARSGGGPYILEMLTYRYRGHGGVAARAGSGEKRRDDTDPITKARSRLLEIAIATDGELKSLEKSVREEVIAAAAAAKAAPFPATSELFGGLSA